MKKKKTETKSKTFHCQIEKSTFKKLIKEQSKYNGIYFDNILRGIKFELKEDILTMVSTDGNRLLETKIKVESPCGNGSGVYDGNYLGAIRFMKNICITSDAYIDMLQLNFDADCLEIKDLANGIIYQCSAIEGNYPNYKQLIPTVNEKEYTTIGVNMRFLSELNRLSPNERTGIVELSFKNNEPLSPMIAKCDAIEVQTRALIMPIQIRK
jgi:DNA polymerase III sliding clamp (beta) subunit (PCNA family)